MQDEVMKGCADHTSQQSPVAPNAFGKNSAVSGNQGSDNPGKGQDHKVCHVFQAICLCYGLILQFCPIRSQHMLGHIPLYKAIRPTGKELTHATYFSLCVHSSTRLI
eukprot:scaffold15204_cov17-Prasinocladus_malaysianus.AAC.1